MNCRALLGVAPQEWVFAGLNLLRLLVANRIAEFHTELELIPDEVSGRLVCNLFAFYLLEYILLTLGFG